MRILLVEPWLAGSHRAWAEGYAAASTCEVTVLGCSGELWRWRLDGSALPLARMVEDFVDRHGQPDVVLISGMTDVARLRGLLATTLDRQVKVAVYQHESQVVYPHRAAGGDRGPALVNWMSWLAADAVFFNSHHHRHAVAEALPSFLEALPDGSHRAEFDTVVARFEVLPLGIDLTWTAVGSLAGQAAGASTDQTTEQTTGQTNGGPIIVWPHRWEDDKDPLAFGRALDRLSGTGLEYQVVLAGEVTSSQSGLRAQATERHQGRILASGPFSSDEYRRHLLAADIVVSCAQHDFFGAAMVEAVAAGCRPVAPADLAYPETIGEEVCYQPGRFGSALEAAVGEWHDGYRPSPDLAAAVRRHCWTERAPEYDRRLSALVGGQQ